MKNRFWIFMLGITILSLLFSVIFGSEIPWGNIKATCFSWPLAKVILYDISVGVFSSMVLVWCIDRIQLNMSEKEESKRRLIFYNKISPLLEEYYNFYLFLYIATRNTPVSPTSAVLKSLYQCKDELLKQVYDTEPFYKDGYYGDSVKWDLHMNFMQQHSDDPDAMKSTMEMSTSLPWYHCWNIEATKIYNGLSQVEKDFPTFIPNDLLEQIDNLLSLVQTQTNIVSFVEMRSLTPCIKEKVGIPMLPTKMFVDAYKLDETLRVLDVIMAYIENDSSIKLRERNLEFFNNRNTSPILGQACDKIPAKENANQQGKLFMKKIKNNENNKKRVSKAKHIFNAIFTNRPFQLSILCIGFFLISPVVNWAIKTDAFIFPNFLGFVTSENESSWIGFFGAIIGGVITLIGVAWTIKDQNKKRAEDIKDMSRPIIVSTKCDYEKLKNIMNDTSGTKVIECILPIKNAGKGILYNPALYNIDCKIDDVVIESVNPNIPILSHLDVNDSAQYDILTLLSPEILTILYDRLKGRGNTLTMKMYLYVGGNDMYGRTTITELRYCLDITFDSAQKIDLGLPMGNLTSRVLFEKKEIERVLKNRNYKYSL